MERTMCSSADKKLQEFLESVQEDHSHRRMVQQEVNAVSAWTECAAGSVQMVRAAYQRQDPKEYAARTGIP